jgi:hypothetical protein
MILVPASTPDTEPLLPIVATDVLLLLHVPPPVPSVKPEVLPAQKVVAPEMLAGLPITLTVVVVKHPVENAEVIMLVPAEAPNTVPPEFMVATDVLLLLQVLPALLVSVEVLPAHKVVEPVMGAGVALTVTIAVTRQPEPIV